jgi:hypothetical protein
VKVAIEARERVAPHRQLILGLLLLALAGCAAEPARPATAPAPPPPGPAAAPTAPPAPDTERWSGVFAEPLTEAVAREVSVGRAEGLYVREVEPGSPAERAGIQRGDVLLMAGGRYLGTREALQGALAAVPVGTAVPVTVRRGADLLNLAVPAETSPGGRLVAVIQTPPLVNIAADGAWIYGFGPVPGSGDLGIVPLQLPGGPLPRILPRPVASPGAERVIAADAERVYLGWAGSEIYIDVYDIDSGRVGRLPVHGAESLANRCRPRGLARVGSELWMACQRAEGPVVARIELATGAARVEPLPPTYWGGLAYDGQALLWLCCASGGRVSLVRTEVATGVARVFPLPVSAMSVAADQAAVYLLVPGGGIGLHKPWR